LGLNCLRRSALDNQGRKGTIGFALTILQRRLASSPEAIYQSLLRRRERLQQRLREEEISKRGIDAAIDLGYVSSIPNYEDFSDFDTVGTFAQDKKRVEQLAI
jgi:hypothetical protein